MRCVVTGAAGFVGSHLCEELLRRGHAVAGVDSFTPDYPASVKADNQQVVLAHPRYHFHAADLRADPLDGVVESADVVFHLAGPTAARGWADLDAGLRDAVRGTQRLLDAVRRVCPAVRRVVLGSSGAVYGSAVGCERSPTRPATPGGLTALATEHLAHAYADAYHLPLVVLRYFGVYGPRQRPDMAAHRFIDGLLRGRVVEVYGDGRHARAPLYVSDAVAATVAAAEAPSGETYNVAGDEPLTVLELLHVLEVIAGRPVGVRFKPARPGEPRAAVPDVGKLRRHLGWSPRTRPDDGLARQWAWQSAVEPAPHAVADRVAVLS